MFKVTFSTAVQQKELVNYLNAKGFNTKISGANLDKFTIRNASLDLLLATVKEVMTTFHYISVTRIKIG